MNKISKRVFALVIVTVLLLSSICSFVFAEETATAEEKTNPRVEFILSEPDAEGYLTASLVVYDAFFSAAQFGISFDNTVLQFVDMETKELSEDPERVMTLYDFKNEKGTHKFISVGNNFSNSKGTLNVAFYSMPSEASDYGARVTVGEEGFKLYDFSMKMLKKEDPSLDLLDYGSTIYNKEAIISDGETQPVVTVKFIIPASLNETGKEIVVAPIPPEPSLKVLRKERLVDTLILNIGNFAAVDDGYLKVIDEANREVVPFIEGDRTYLPLRFIGEAFGADVKWNPDNQEITVTLNDSVVIMNIGKSEYTVNGEKKEMDVAPFIKEERTFVPVRYIGEALSKAVYWDEALKLVIVTAEENPWNPEGKAEKDILPDALLLISDLVRDMMLSDAE